MHLPHGYQSVKTTRQDGERGEAENKSIELSLFNLSEDPGEMTDVANAHPEIVAELKAKAEQFQQEIDKNKREAGKSLTATH